MDIFVGRDKEITAVSAFINGENEGILCLYGRRGVGKTALINNALAGKKRLIYNAASTTDWGIVSDLAECVLDSFDISCDSLAEKSEAVDTAEAVLYALTQRQFNTISSYGNLSSEAYEILTDYKKAFAYILDYVANEAALNGRMVIVIDNYPELVKAGEFAEILKYSYENSFGDAVKLILISDSYAQAEKYIYGKKSEWKGVSVNCIEVQPLNFYSAKAFYPEASPSDMVFFYGITGGMPCYLTRIYGHTDTRRRAVERIFFDADETSGINSVSILSNDLREFAYYNRLLTLLAAGNMRVNHLSDLFEKPKDIVVPYLTTLIGLGMVIKENSVTEKSNRKKTRYYIANTYDLFFYKYIFNNMNLIKQKRFDDVFKKIDESIGEYMHAVMTKVCREYLALSSDRMGMDIAVHEVGNWWENDDESGTTKGFDMLALGKNGDNEAYIFGRVFCEGKPVDISMLKSLLDLTKRVPKTGVVKYVMFSENGFHENVITAAKAIKDIRLVDISEITELV